MRLIYAKFELQYILNEAKYTRVIIFIMLYNNFENYYIISD